MHRIFLSLMSLNIRKSTFLLMLYLLLLADVRLPLVDCSVLPNNGMPKFANDEVISSSLLNDISVSVLVKCFDEQNNRALDVSVKTYLDAVYTGNVTCSSDRSIEVVLVGPNITLFLYLKKSQHLLTQRFVKKYYVEGSDKPIVEKASDGTSWCSFYTGEVLGAKNSYASLNLDKGVNGIIEIEDSTYEIKTYHEDGKIYHKIINTSKDAAAEEPHTCGNEDQINQDYLYLENLQRFRRQIRLPASSNYKTRYIEMYAVSDSSVFKRASSVDAAIMRLINIVNYASGLYSQLNVYIALVGVEVWNTGNRIPYRLNDSYLDSGQLLTDFNKYRQNNISYETPNDNAQLFTAEKFMGGLIGKGSTEGICTRSNSAGVTFDGDTQRYVRAATTMAHELGHNLGLPHTNSDIYFGKNCECPDDEDPSFKDCIMHSSANPHKQPKKWGQCTADTLLKMFDEYNLDHCLKNVPEKLMKIGTTPICGNFFVEEGEECDCGYPGDCTSKCCNPSTCKLNVNATCATGTCCDLESCTLKPKSYICRPSNDKHCDLEEACSGDSEWCPEDTYKYNGFPCNSVDGAYCYDGKCRSQDSQCKFIWGGYGVRKANDICYQYFNNHSNYFGNCGWETLADGASSIKYHSCKTDEDKFCGLLHCAKDDWQDLTARIRNFPFLSPFRQTVKGQACIISSYDVGYKEYDPGQVPNGAKCAENKMCVNSKCVNVPSVTKECECNSRGVCNQKGECHCDIGWAPPDCKKPGLGGSLTSNPPVIAGPDIDLIVGLVAFFGGIIPIVAIVVIVLYCRRVEVKRFLHRLCGRYSKAASKPPPARPQPPNKPEVPHQSPTVSNISEQQKKENISLPYLQSTTNKGSDISSSVKIRQPPLREAPPPPMKGANGRSIPSGQNYENTSVSTKYENVKPATPPKLPAKPAVPEKSGKPVSPPVPSKPAFPEKSGKPASPPVPSKPVLRLQKPN